MPDRRPSCLLAWPRRTPGVAVVGLLGSALLVLTAGRAVISDQVQPATTWWGLLTPLAAGPWRGLVPLGEFAGVALLAAAWVWLLRLVREGRLGPGGVGRIAACWAVPLVAGPPLLSLDAYSYLAQGHLQHIGLNPYLVGPQASGPGPFLDAVDPRWRLTSSPYGPLAMIAARLCAALGPSAGLVALHVIAAAALTVCGVLLAALCAPGRQAFALAMAVANPLVLLELLGAGHWEALVAVAVLGALLLWQRGHPLMAIAVASAGSAVKAPIIVAVVVLAGLHVAADSSVPVRLRAAGGAVVAAVLPWLLAAAVQPDALGFVAGLRSSLSGRTIYGPSTAVTELLAGAGHVAGTDVDFARLLSAVQLAGIAAAAALALALLLTARRRPPAETIGLTLLGVALLGPVVYPWYLTWGLFPLVAAGRAGRRLSGLSVAAIFTALPGCQQLSVFLPARTTPSAPWVVAAAVVIVSLAVMLWARREATAYASVVAMPRLIDKALVHVP
ncbi:MAG: alpha,6-mannosyltransferase [Frankiales bacterium]|nr:alpha,6-mannosyltransferase [Frankiales bacterium]